MTTVATQAQEQTQEKGTYINGAAGHQTSGTSAGTAANTILVHTLPVRTSKPRTSSAKSKRPTRRKRISFNPGHEQYFTHVGEYVYHNTLRRWFSKKTADIVRRLEVAQATNLKTVKTVEHVTADNPLPPLEFPPLSVMPKEKKCYGPLCKGQLRPWHAFATNAALANRLQGFCRECANEQSRIYSQRRKQALVEAVNYAEQVMLAIDEPQAQAQDAPATRTMVEPEVTVEPGAQTMIIPEAKPEISPVTSWLLRTLKTEIAKEFAGDTSDKAKLMRWIVESAIETYEQP